MTIRHVPSEGVGYASVVLDRPAPPGGLTVALESLDTGVATVPALVYLDEGYLGQAFPVTWVAAGATQVRASLDGVEAFIDIGCLGVIEGFLPVLTDETLVELEPAPKVALSDDDVPDSGVALSLVPSPTSGAEEEELEPRPTVGLDLRPSPTYAGE
jgi:hypothetical protein